MALLIVMIILLCLPIFLFFVLRRHVTSSYASSLPPGPKGLPFIGNLHQFDSSKPHVSFWELSKKYGPLMSLRIGFVPTLIVSSAKMAKETLKAHDLQFSGRPASVATQRLTYNGLDLIFSPYERLEKCVVHLFNSIRAQNFRPIREDENPEEFNPERFIDRSVDFKGQNFEFIPFGAGRRICPGMHLGIASVDLALANLLYKFDWEMPPGMKKQDLDFDSLSGITVHKKNFLVLLAKYHEYRYEEDDEASQRSRFHMH
ncbi:hypothetical protein CUMW_215970 [Citrus unshiu]|uniref:Cytochrome P450 n=1 Tax=Citrus unshiu TaxID=55188 RepID=A0A2H5QC39_CITUN|nr:hypothetical protein CUMW_215970 [Citrus unshiu]